MVDEDSYLKVAFSLIYILLKALRVSFKIKQRKGKV